MSSLHRYPGHDLSEEELAFGATIMCTAFCRKPLTQEQRDAFLSLYGLPGELLLISVETGYPVSVLTASQLLMTIVPELHEHFIEQSAVFLAESARVMTSKNGVLGRLAASTTAGYSPFEQLRQHRQRQRKQRSADIAAGGSGHRFFLETKKNLGRHTPRFEL